MCMCVLLQQLNSSVGSVSTVPAFSLSSRDQTWFDCKYQFPWLHSDLGRSFSMSSLMQEMIQVPRVTLKFVCTKCLSMIPSRVHSVRPQVIAFIGPHPICGTTFQNLHQYIPNWFDRYFSWYPIILSNESVLQFSHFPSCQVPLNRVRDVWGVGAEVDIVWCLLNVILSPENELMARFSGEIPPAGFARAQFFECLKLSWKTLKLETRSWCSCFPVETFQILWNASVIFAFLCSLSLF